MTGPCVNDDGAGTEPGRLLCKECERRLMDALAVIGEDAMPLLLVATERASVSTRQGSGHTAPAQAPSPLRDGMWELYCETERLLRQLGLRFDYAKAVDPRATVRALANAAITDPASLLSSGDVLAWYQDITDIARRIHTAVNPAGPRMAFGACPSCGSVVWGDPRRTVRRMHRMWRQGEPSGRRRPSAGQAGRQRGQGHAQAVERRMR